MDLSRATGVDCVMARDSHSLCLSERLHGGAKHLDNFVMLDLCTGVGMGVMVNGRFLAGQNGFAGEIGHSDGGEQRPSLPLRQPGLLGNRGESMGAT